jgi:hypothetical protein
VLCHYNIAANTPGTRGWAIISLPQINQWIYFLRLRIIFPGSVDLPSSI